MFVALLGSLVPLRVDDFPFQRARFNEGLERLLDKKRIAACPSIEKSCKWSNGGWIDSERCMEELSDFCLAQRTETDLRRNAEASERLLGGALYRIDVALGVIVSRDECHTLSRYLSRDKMKKLERRCVGPLEILEHEAQWLLRRVSAEELAEIPE